MTIEQWLGSDNKLGIDIWHKKYQHNNESFEEWLDRVSNGNEEVKELIKEKKFLFGGRTLSNRGLDTGGSYSNCFIAGTQVLTQEGYKAIEDIQVGEYVLTHDGTYQKVNDVMSRHYKGQGIRFYDSRLYDDIICTPNHKFLTQRGWVEAQEIYQCNKYQSSKNYKLYSIHEESRTFINTWDIETVELDETVYNLSVENNHDYVVQGISVHNCYSSGYVEDDYNSIMQTAVDIGLTFKAQGGQGVSLTKLRPKGTPIKNNYTSDGIIPFMKIYNEVTAGTSQGGSRKGALMISLDIRHAEAANFITVKSQEGVIEKANLSLEIDDEFMEAVEKYYETGEVVTLHEKRDYSGHIVEYDVVPIEIFKLLVDNSYDWGDPACLFTNRFRNYNIMEFDDDYQIETSNP